MAEALATYCTQMLPCCTSTPAFTLSTCETQLTTSEYVPFTNLGILFPGQNSTNVTLDLVNAQQCLADMSAIQCGSNDAAFFVSLYNDCSAALVPQLGLGDTGCLTSFDCADGYCGPFTDDMNNVPQQNNGTGTCLPLNLENTPCGDNGYSTDCAHEGTLAAGLYCGPTGGNITDLTCQAAETDSSSCTDTDQPAECTSGVCEFISGDSFECEESAPGDVIDGFSICADN